MPKIKPANQQAPEYGYHCTQCGNRKEFMEIVSGVTHVTQNAKGQIIDTHDDLGTDDVECSKCGSRKVEIGENGLDWKN